MYSQLLRKVITRRAILATCALGLLFAAVWQYQGVLFHAPLGAEISSGAAAAKLLSDEGLGTDYVDIAADATLDTGFAMRSEPDPNSTAEPEQPEYHILVASVGDRLLLIKAATEIDADRYRGITEESDPALVSALLENIEPDRKAELEAALLPVTLNATSDWRLPGTIGALTVLLVILAFLAYSVRNALAYKTPSKHGRVRTAAQGDPQQFLDWLDADLAASAASSPAKLIVGSHHLALTRNAKLIPQADLVWAYPSVVQRRVYGVPVGKKYGIQLCEKYGRTSTTELSEQDCQAALHRISQTAPWAALGYSQLFSAKWNQARTAFAAEIEQRRQAHQQTSAHFQPNAQAPSAQPALAGAITQPAQPAPIGQPAAAAWPRLLSGNRATWEAFPPW